MFSKIVATPMMLAAKRSGGSMKSTVGIVRKAGPGGKRGWGWCTSAGWSLLTKRMSSGSCSSAGPDCCWLVDADDALAAVLLGRACVRSTRLCSCCLTWSSVTAGGSGVIETMSGACGDISSSLPTPSLLSVGRAGSDITRGVALPAGPTTAGGSTILGHTAVVVPVVVDVSAARLIAAVLVVVVAVISAVTSASVMATAVACVVGAALRRASVAGC